MVINQELFELELSQAIRLQLIEVLAYEGITVKELTKITKSNGEINYEAAVKGKDLIFDAAGKFLKEVKD